MSRCLTPLRRVFADASSRFGLAAGLVLSLGSNAAAGTPDLAVLNVMPPQDLHIGVVHNASLEVWNIDDAYSGDYTVELLLSTDDVLDGSDILIQSETSDVFATLVLFFTVPPSVPAGPYRWIARVLSVDGEVDATNNVYVAGDVTVFDTDLQVPDPAPIVFQTEWQEPAQVDAELEVANVGTAASLLVFTTQLVTPAPWLTLDLGDSFAIEGEAPASVTLRCDSTGLALGSYSTTVRFRNVHNLADFQDVTVTLDVGNHKIVLGDRLRGNIAEPGDLDEVRFDALAGTRVILYGHVLAGKLKLVVTAFAPSGGVETVLQYKNVKNPLKKSFIAQESGTYRLVVSGKGATTGGYRVKTERRNPKFARPREETATDEGLGFDELPVLLYAGATLDFGIDPDSEFAGPVAVDLFDPGGAPVDLSLAMTQGLNGEVAAESLIAPLIGEYRIRVAGFGEAPGASARVLILPVQPPKGNSKVYLP